MKVLQINSVCGVGSTGRIATDIHAILVNNGHESYIAYGRGLSNNCNTSIKIGSDIDIYSHVAKTRILDKHGFGSKNATIELINKIEKLNPEVIHLHNIHGYYVNVELLFNYLKTSNKRIIWTLHDCWAFTGHCTYFDYVDCDKWIKGCYSCPQKNEYPKSIIVDASKNNYQKKKNLFTGLKNLTIVTPSNWLANLVKKSFLKEYDIEVINNGIDLNIFKPTKSEFRQKYGLEDKFIILGVANVWDRRKGIDYFVKISSKLKSNEKIVLVGVTERQKRDLPKNILGITRTNNIEELAEIYSTSNIFLNPTLEDNFPTVNLEALACGTPVFTFDTGGSIECIDENVGVIINKSLSENIEFSKYKFDTNLCRKKALEYDKKSQFNKYIDIYMR